jgi:hypothetical protein
MVHAKKIRHARAAGIQGIESPVKDGQDWIPACAGMTGVKCERQETE